MCQDPNKCLFASSPSLFESHLMDTYVFLRACKGLCNFRGVETESEENPLCMKTAVHISRPHIFTALSLGNFFISVRAIKL